MESFQEYAGEPDIKEKLLKGGDTAIGRDYKRYLNGYNILPPLTGETHKSPRKEIFYFSDEGDRTALKYNDRKMILMKQKSPGTFRVWRDPSCRCGRHSLAGRYER